MRRLIGALLAAAIAASLGVSATTARADTIYHPPVNATMAASAPPHTGLAPAIPASGVTCSHAWAALTYTSGGYLQETVGTLFTANSGPVLRMCTVSSGGGWYYWIPYGTSQCMTYNATYGIVDFIQCQGLVSQVWYLFNVSGSWDGWENAYGYGNTVMTDAGINWEEYISPWDWNGTWSWYAFA